MFQSLPLARVCNPLFLPFFVPTDSHGRKQGKKDRLPVAKQSFLLTLQNAGAAHAHERARSNRRANS